MSEAIVPVPLTIGSTDEVRALVAVGEVKPGDAALDRPVDSMTDREIIVENLLIQRQTRDLVQNLVNDVMAGPLGAMIAGGKSPFSAMFGR